MAGISRPSFMDRMMQEKQKSKFARGCTNLPNYVAKALSKETIKLLATNGHGLSFPDKTYVQVRLVRDGVRYGTHFNYAKHGGIQATIDHAIDYYKKLLEEIPYTPTAKGKGMNNLRFCTKINSRNGMTEYYHVVTYVDPVSKKRTTRNFYHGTNPPSAGQWLHGQHTALYFQIEQQRIADQFGTKINHRKFDNWKTVRLYWEGAPALDYDSI